MSYPFSRISALAALLATALGACAAYSPQPLPTRDDLTDRPAAVESRPLDLDAVATLAVLNGPDLKAARARLRVADAQAFAAGLLPDPQASGSSDRPTDRAGPADLRYPEYNAWNYGLTLDLHALLTHHDTYRAARAALDQSRLDLLWQEWQSVAQARTLYVQRHFAEERLRFLHEAETIVERQASHSRTALEAGDVAIDQADTDLALLNDLRTQCGAAERLSLSLDSALHELLGIRPQVALPLASLGTPQIPQRAESVSAIASLADRRPDLLALKAGYRSEEALLRKAVLSQFPNVSVGFSRASDTSNVHTHGFSVSLNLPLFERGRGDVAVQRATREQLRAEYQTRLDQSIGDAEQLRHEIELVREELAGLEKSLPDLDLRIERARAAFEAGNYPAATYATLVSAWLSAHGARFDLDQTLWADSIALATVLGTQIQPASNR